MKRQPSPADTIADVTPATEHKRLVAELQSMADMYERLPVSTTADPQVLSAAERLHEVLDWQIEAGRRHLEVFG